MLMLLTVNTGLWAGCGFGGGETSAGGGRRTTQMSNGEIGASRSLGMRVADLRVKMRDARITENEIKTFQKVAAIMGCGEGSLRIDADDLIAASFLVEMTVGEPTLS
jgi:hypothetical protein